MSPTCDACGYDLRGTPEADRCPECGAAVDRGLSPPRTPWLGRGSRILAFWRTAWLATWRPARIALDVARPADLRASLRFRRWLTLWLAAWPVAIAILLYVDTVISSRRFGTSPATNPWLTERPGSLAKRWSDGWIADGDWANHWTWWLDAACFAAALAMLVASIAMSLGVQTYFCHPCRLPRDTQDRAIAVGYYAAAPLAWLPLALIAAIAIEWAWLPNLEAWSWSAQPSPAGPTTQFAARLAQASPFAMIVALYLRAIATVVRLTTSAGPLRGPAAAATCAIAWPLLFVLFPVATLAALALLQWMAFSAGWVTP